MRRGLAVYPCTGALAVLALSLPTGCASFTPDRGMTPVAFHVAAEIGKDAVKIESPADALAARQRVEALLAKPLTPDAAVQIALLNNRGLQADYNALGISETAFVEASLPPNPTLSLERLATGGELEIERRVVANVLALLTLPTRREIAASQFEAARLRAIEATFRLAAETRRAFYRAVAAREIVSYLEQARLSAEIVADLTKKLGETGAANKLAQARAGASHAEVSAQLAQARLRAGTEREALTRLMGLWGRDLDFKLPGRLPDLPKRVQPAGQIEADAVRRRVDLIAARLQLDATAKALGLTQATRFVSALELAGISRTERKREDGAIDTSHPKGFELEIQIPIFDGGSVAVRRAEETYLQAVNRLAERAVAIRSEARAAYLGYRGTYDIARQYQSQVLPLRRIVNEQALLEYNGMIIDVLELLTTNRESIASNVAAIEAKRNFFIACVDFQTALIGGGGTAPSGETTGPAAAAAPAGGH